MKHYDGEETLTMRRTFRAALCVPLLFGLGAIPQANGGRLLEFREVDGSNNNLTQKSMGEAGVALDRSMTIGYADGLSAPAGPNRVSARVVSNNVATQQALLDNSQPVTDFVWQWGQFLDHDIDLTPGHAPAEAFDINVPRGDPWFDPKAEGNKTIRLDRSIHAADGNGVRQQRNMITAWIDGSNVYGSDADRARELRRMDGTGKLKTTPHGTGDLLPFNVNGLPNDPTPLDPTFFLAGDARANEQIGLTALHTLFVREHNHLCDQLAQLFPRLPGELRYQLARMAVVGELQKITYDEFLPVLLGPNALPAYSGYDGTIDAGITNFFSTAAYRFGHSMLSPSLLRRDAQGLPIAAGDIALRDAFFDPDEIISNGGIDPILRGLAIRRPQEIDPFITENQFQPNLRILFEKLRNQWGNVQAAKGHGGADF